MKCFNCGKGIIIGRQHKHHPGVAGGRWKRRAPKTVKVFHPNLHAARLLIAGNYKRVKLCTKCLRLMRKEKRLTPLSTSSQKTSVSPLAL